MALERLNHLAAPTLGMPQINLDPKTVGIAVVSGLVVWGGYNLLFKKPTSKRVWRGTRIEGPDGQTGTLFHMETKTTRGGLLRRHR